MTGLHIVATAARTPVGLLAETSAAAVRAGVCRLRQLPFITPQGQALRGASDARLPMEAQGRARWQPMLASVVNELRGKLGAIDLSRGGCEVLLALPCSRPGFSESDAQWLVQTTAAQWSAHGVQAWAEIGGRGHAGAMACIKRIAAHASQPGAKPAAFVVIGIDSYFHDETLLWLEGQRRLAEPAIPSGFQPGEAAAGLVLVNDHLHWLSLASVVGVGLGQEKRLRDSETGSLGEGLTEAVLHAATGLALPHEAVDAAYFVSANTHGPTKFVGPGSLDVKSEGKNVQLLGDPVLNNCGNGGSSPNAATLVGVLQGPGMAAVFGDEDCPLCGKAHGQDGKLEESADTRGAVADVRAAIDAARTAANAENAARVAEIDAEITGLERQVAGLTRKQRGPINQVIQPLKQERNRLSVELSAMMGAVKCKCGKTYAGTSLVQYRDVVSRYPHHAPNPYHSLTKQPDKKSFKPRRFQKFQEAIADNNKETFRDVWQECQAFSRKSAEGNTPEMGYPPGTCAAQLMVLLTIDHSGRPVGLTEQWYSSKGSTLSKLMVRDLTSDGPGLARPATPEELSGTNPIPPCRTCQVILQALMCTKRLECEHEQPKKKVCYRC